MALPAPHDPGWIKLTDNQRAFALAIASGVDHKDAFREFFPERIKEIGTDKNLSRAAWRERHKPQVQAAIYQAMEHLVAESPVTLGEVITRIRTVSDKAEDKGQHFAALKGAEMLGKVAGLFTDRLAITHTLAGGIAGDLSRLTEDELTMLEWLHGRLQGDDTPCPFSLVRDVTPQ